LRETQKTQNLRAPLDEAVLKLTRAGLEVMGGFIVGFDNDPREIFQLQFDFIQRSGVVTAMVGLLNALPETALYRRLEREGRLLAESCGNNTDAALNFVARLDRAFLLNGYRELMRRLYEPTHYYRRIRTFLRAYRVRGPASRLSGADVRAFLRSIWLLGVRHAGRRAFWRLFATSLASGRGKFRVAMELAILGYHFREVARSI
jgi:radical SAM superfamily enzyme YgiQ (UPF0313 family)